MNLARNHIMAMRLFTVGSDKLKGLSEAVHQNRLQLGRYIGSNNKNHHETAEMDENATKSQAIY